MLKEYLDKLNEEIENEDACGFAIDSFPTRAHKRPLTDVIRPAYPNEAVDPDTGFDIDAQRIMIDFDKVIHKYSIGWQEGIIYDEPVKGVRDVINYLKKGYKVIIFTSRMSETVHGKDGVEKQRRMIEEWLKKYDIQVDGITAEKLPAILYIDDRTYCFNGYKTGWTNKDVMEIKNKIKENL
jgi:hypothetical protein